MVMAEGKVLSQEEVEIVDNFISVTFGRLLHTMREHVESMSVELSSFNDKDAERVARLSALGRLLKSCVVVNNVAGEILLQGFVSPEDEIRTSVEKQ